MGADIFIFWLYEAYEFNWLSPQMYTLENIFLVFSCARPPLFLYSSPHSFPTLTI